MRRYQPQHLAPRPASSRRPRLGRRLGAAAVLVVAAPAAVTHVTHGMASAGGPTTGTVAALGEAANYGSADGQAVAGMARTPSGRGYWLVTSAGRVFPFGDAAPLGEPPARRASGAIVDIASTPDGQGYWLVATDGTIFAFGTAAHHGSVRDGAINAPVVGITSSPGGNGYWLVARDGGVFAFGDATFLGSAGSLHLNQPITGIASTPSGNGYRLVGGDGGVFTFGDATFAGSVGDRRLNEPIVGIAGTPTGTGYWLVARDGGVFTFGDAQFHGSLAAGRGTTAGAPIVDIAGTPGGKGQWLANGGRYLGDFVVTCYALRGTTASGAKAGPGVVAVDPRVVPLGTELYVGGQGTMTALDTGGKIKGRRLDIWRRSAAECRAFGRQKLPVFAPAA